MEEKKYERKIIKKLRDDGFYATHIDSTVPGFPDIFAVKSGKVFLLEVKDGGRSHKSMFEPSQPPFFWDVKHKGGFKNILVLEASKEGCDIHSISFLEGALRLSKIAECPGYEGIAGELLKVAT